jgi:hypothetical protein
MKDLPTQTSPEKKPEQPIQVIHALDPNSVDTVIFLNKFSRAHHAQS